MCMYCKRDMELVEAVYTDEYGNDYSANVYVKDGKLKVKLIKETMDGYEELAFDENEIRYCPMCGRDLREKENRKPQVANTANKDKTVYCVTCDDVLDDYVECTFYNTLGEAKDAAESAAFYGDGAFYIHELTKGRAFRTELVTTYETLEVLP